MYRFVIFALLSFVLAFHASAQDEHEYSKQFSPPENHFNYQTGIDLKSGKYIGEGPDLKSVDGLSLTRLMSAHLPMTFGNYSLKELAIARESVFVDPSTQEAVRRITIHIDGAAKSFDSKGQSPNFLRNNPDAGHSLEVSGDKNSPDAVYTFTSKSGLRATFRPIGSGDCKVGQGRCAFVDYIHRPDGRKFDFFYSYDGSNQLRLKQIRGSLGYSIYLSYNSSGFVRSACVANLANETFFGHCEGQGKAHVEYEYEQARLTKILWADGDRRAFSYSSDGLERFSFIPVHIRTS